MNREYHQPRSVLATHITPAILTDDFKDLVLKLGKITSIVDWVQIDVVDGIYTANKTWPFVNDDKGIFTSIVRQDEPMPFWDEMSFEIDLMVKDPVFEADRWIAAGAMRLVVHLDSIELDAFVDLAKNIQEKGVELVIGFAINSSHEKLDEYLRALSDAHVKTKGVQCMGIDRIGSQHQAFNPEVLEHIKKIKKQHPTLFISVDGGVHMDTAQSIIDAGADRLVVGSTVFDSESIKDTIVELSNMFNK